MITGNWLMKVETPIGEMDLTMTLEENEGIITGTCYFNKHEGKIEGTIQDSSFNMKTSIPTPFGNTKFKIAGSVDGERISGRAKAGALGSFGFEGKHE